MKNEINLSIESSRVSVNTEIEATEPMLSVNGVSAIHRGDLIAIKAKIKSGKTTSIAAMVAALLKGEWGPLEAPLSDTTKIIAFDTEQNILDTKAWYLRMLRMAGMPEEDNFDRFQVFNLRNYAKEERINMIQAVIEEYKPEIAFIDGIADLCADFNNVAESTSLIENISKWASSNNTTIVAVLHTNKSSDDRNLKGHLGSLLGQKSNVVFECKKDKDNIFSVSCAESRHAPFDTWSWKFDEDGEVLPVDTPNVKKDKNNLEEERENIIIEYVRNHADLTRRGLSIALAPVLNLSKNAIGDRINKMIDNSTLTLVGNTVQIPEPAESECSEAESIPKLTFFCFSYNFKPSNP